MTIDIAISINGIARKLRIDPDDYLLDTLREDLELTGSKRGCDDASCGACTVIVDGKARNACVWKTAKLENTHVRTIEGIAHGQVLSRIQHALIQAGAVQCGYCTPGIVMELTALYESNPNADLDTIKRSLKRHFCRCTGYESILEGALNVFGISAS